MTERNIDNLVVGLGKTGLSCARYLARRGASFAVADSRMDPPGLETLRAEFPAAPVFLGDFDAVVFQRAQRLIVSPGVSVHEPAIEAARKHGAEIVGDIELFAREAKAPVIAITGSNGKSTVTTLVGEMLREAGRKVRVGGNLGTPALDLLGDGEPDVYVLELSSFQLETTHTLDAAAATVLNVSPDHLDRYRGMAEYAAAKAIIYRGTGVMVVNRDDPVVMDMVAPGRRVVGFSLHEPQGEQDYGLSRQQGQIWLAKGQKLLMAVDEMRIKGLHNAANALASLALCEAVGLTPDSLLQTLRTFAGLAHRTQWVGEGDGVAWYNDSKGTNIGATIAALNGMPGKVVLIAGGLGKGADFTLLRPAVAEKARAVVLIGRDAPLIEEALEAAVPMVRAGDMDEAVDQARRLAQCGDTVLLSPACASFDMFKGYDDRGNCFVQAVQRVLAS